MFFKEMNDFRNKYGLGLFRGSFIFGINSLRYLLKKDSIGPVFAGWDITYRCNARCNHCDRWRGFSFDPV